MSLPQKPTVLIVDDELDIRTMLVEMLSLEGYPTETAVNGREALEALATKGPRVVLLDLLMPVMDGRTFIQHLQGNPAERARHKIVLISALRNLESNRDLYQHVDGQISKPFTVDQLVNTLNQVVAGA